MEAYNKAQATSPLIFFVVVSSIATTMHENNLEKN